LSRDLLGVYRVLQTIEVAAPAYLGSGRPLTGIVSGPGLPAPPDEGTTAIWDAVALTSNDVLANAAGLRRRAIILLSDGLNTTGRLSRTEAINRVLAAEGVEYTIGVGSKRDGLGGRSGDCAARPSAIGTVPDIGSGDRSGDHRERIGCVALVAPSQHSAGNGA